MSATRFANNPDEDRRARLGGYVLPFHPASAGSKILSGFKSYPVRTQITGWDPSFNAITGLNGTGKSNILDAISFVLGLTNMTTVSTCWLSTRSCADLVPDARVQSNGLNLQTRAGWGHKG